MFKTPTNTPEMPSPEMIEYLRLLASRPAETIDQLAGLLMTLRAQSISPAALDPEIHRGILRYMSHVSLRLAAIRCQNAAEFRTKVRAMDGALFHDSDLDTARAVQLLMRAESKRMGTALESVAVHDGTPAKPVLNS